MPNITVSIHEKGPFFTLPGNVIHTVLNDAIKEMVAEGETLVTNQLYEGHGVKTGHYRRSVHGRLLDTIHGEVHDSRVVYGPWLEGTSSRNQTTRFKGYAMFRQAREKLETKVRGILRAAIKRGLGL